MGENMIFAQYTLNLGNFTNDSKEKVKKVNQQETPAVVVTIKILTDIVKKTIMKNRNFSNTTLNPIKICN